MPTPLARRPLLAALLLALAASLLLAPVASSAPARGVGGTAAKACKQRKGESRKHWQKRCKCAKPKKGESRKRFKKRCPARKKPNSTAPGTTAPGTTAPGTTAPAAPGPLTGQAAVDKVTQGLIGTQLQYFTYSQTSGSSEDERYTFCTGTFSYTRNRVGISGVAYNTNATANWHVTSANVNADQVSGSAVLHYDLTSYNSTDVDPPPPASGDVQVNFNGAKVNFGGRAYDATKVAC
jgi:hypothetical protein